MNSSVCVDASLLIRTLVPDAYSPRCELLLAGWLETEQRLIAPALLAFEVTATLRRLVYQQVISPARGEAAFATFQRIPVRLSHRQQIFPLAWDLAKQLNRLRAYDTAYLATAQLSRCEFWTADERLYNAVKSQLNWVRWVGEPGPDSF
ncbi:MAG: type II toxin-antitoxin system VapC family toxin [Caldilineaceae bacterium]|nr:type II toxin-antitoxin system VapC family toxin [Caldilineaceae bacterium]